MARILKTVSHIQLLFHYSKGSLNYWSLICRRHNSSQSDTLIDVKRIRNFSIVAHVDHGKSTLADRLLEITGVIQPGSEKSQVLDNLQVERERGITVKAVTASLNYTYKNEKYLLNLIDTPGHVDFSNEVVRSVSACQGVILLVDANEGVQAQTVAVHSLAKKNNLTIIPVLNKVDLPRADPENVMSQMHSLFNIDPSTVLKISAKKGWGVSELLEAVITRIPPPIVDLKGHFRAHIIDTWHDRYRGIMCLAYIHSGRVKVGQAVKWRSNGSQNTVKFLALLRPSQEPVDAAGAGQVVMVGKPHLALKLAISCGDTNAMIAAVETLGEKVDPELAQTLAAHLRNADHHSHAAALLATAGQYEDALEIVETASTPLSEELSERLAAPVGTSGRDALLRRLADVLGARGLYHQAAKRLAQAGDKAGAMRWLMRSGDADRIATFASAARDRTAQLMAADYLRRRSDWRSRPDLTRHILHFYTRSKAYGKLAGFYAECAKMEVDEYDNYEKAVEALKEATRCLAKASDPETEAQTIALQEQSTLVKRFLDVKKTLEAGEINQGVTSGQQLLRVVSGQSGLTTEEKLLKLLLHHAPNHPDAAEFEKRIRDLKSMPVDDSFSTDSHEQSIEEII